MGERTADKNLQDDKNMFHNDIYFVVLSTGHCVGLCELIGLARANYT